VTPASPDDAVAVDAAVAALVPRIEIVGGNPSPAEVAAVTAVLAAVLEELGALDASASAAAAGQGPSAWQRSQRPIRTPLHPGHGVWRGFSG